MTILIFTFYSYCLAEASFPTHMHTYLFIYAYVYVFVCCAHMYMHSIHVHVYPNHSPWQSCFGPCALVCLLLPVMFAASYAFGIFLFIALCFNRCCMLQPTPAAYRHSDVLSCQYGFHFLCCALFPLVVDHFGRCLQRVALQSRISNSCFLNEIL